MNKYVAKYRLRLASQYADGQILIPVAVDYPTLRCKGATGCDEEVTSFYKRKNIDKTICFTVCNTHEQPYENILTFYGWVGYRFETDVV